MFLTLKCLIAVSGWIYWIIFSYSSHSTGLMNHVRIHQHSPVFGNFQQSQNHLGLRFRSLQMHKSVNLNVPHTSISLRAALQLLKNDNTTPTRAHNLIDSLLKIQNLSDKVYLAMLIASVKFKLIDIIEQILQILDEKALKLSNPQVSAIISILSNNEQNDLALKFIQQQIKHGFQPVVHNFSALLRYCRTPEEAFSLLQRMEALGVHPNVFSFTAAVKSCESTGDWRSALEFLDMMRINGVKPNEVTYCCLIGVAARGYAFSVAIALLREMQGNFAPNPFCYGGALYACVRCSAWDSLETLIKEMDYLKVPLLESVMISLINGCKRVQRQSNASDSIDRSFLGLPDHSGKYLVHWEKAIWLLKLFSNRSHVLSDSAYTMCMDVCALAGKHQEVVSIHEMMKSSKIPFTKSSLSLTFKACIELRDCDSALNILRDAIQLDVATLPMFISSLNLLQQHWTETNQRTIGNILTVMRLLIDYHDGNGGAASSLTSRKYQILSESPLLSNREYSIQSLKAWNASDVSTTAIEQMKIVEDIQYVQQFVRLYQNR